MDKPPFLHNPIAKTIFFEFTGTLFFVYGIALADLPGYPTDIFVSASLFLAICWAGQLTGGHFNPAVTVGIKVNGGVNRVWPYIVSQFLGSFLGALLSYYVGRGTIEPNNYTGAKEVIADFFSEMVGTFAFVLSILVVTTKSTTFAKKPLYIYAFIPASLFVCRRLCAGAGLNPAVTIMGSLVNVIVNGGDFKYFWVQGIPPFIGGALAAIFFKFFFSPMHNYYKVESRRKSL